MNSIARMVDALKATEQDFEWYPTTQEMIDVIVADARELFSLRDDE